MTAMFDDPVTGAESTAFFEAAREGRFLLRRSVVTGRAHWYPRKLCPFDFSETEWFEASGHGTIYSYSVMRRAVPPYAIAYVALAEGPVMMSTLVDCEFDTLAIGQAVQIVFKPSRSGIPVPCFRPLA